MTLIDLLIFFLCLILGMPIAFVLGVSSLIIFLRMGDPGLFGLIPMRFYNSINMFPLMAMPLFILAGEIMNKTGITLRLINLSDVLVGHWRGGLAHANILTSILFAGLSGSAVSDSAALGTMMIPGMEEKGYSRKFAAAVTAASSCIGPIIPPSVIMIIYGAFMQVSIAGLFAAGIIPGLLMGGVLVLHARRISKKRNYPKRENRASLKETYTSVRKSILPLLLPGIILFGILGGLFTPTEAAGIAVFYALFIGFIVYRNLSIKDLWKIFCEMTRASGIAFLVISTAGIFTWLLSSEQIPQQIAGFVLELTTNKYLILLLINVLMLLVGCFMDSVPAVIILGPVLTPLMASIGMHPLHFGVVMCLNLTVGLATPPLGACLFTCCAIGRVSIEDIMSEIWPFIVSLIIVILLVTFVPSISLFVPRLLGFA